MRIVAEQEAMKTIILCITLLFVPYLSVNLNDENAISFMSADEAGQMAQVWRYYHGDKILAYQWDIDNGIYFSALAKAAVLVWHWTPEKFLFLMRLFNFLGLVGSLLVIYRLSVLYFGGSILPVLVVACRPSVSLLMRSSKPDLITLFFVLVGFLLLLHGKTVRSLFCAIAAFLVKFSGIFLLIPILAQAKKKNTALLHALFFFFVILVCMPLNVFFAKSYGHQVIQFFGGFAARDGLGVSGYWATILDRVYSFDIVLIGLFLLNIRNLPRETKKISVIFLALPLACLFTPGRFTEIHMLPFIAVAALVACYKPSRLVRGIVIFSILLHGYALFQDRDFYARQIGLTREARAMWLNHVPLDTHLVRRHPIHEYTPSEYTNVAYGAWNEK